MNPKVKKVLLLSIPAVLAEVSSIAMQYIDASMVGFLGAQASASIGLVASTTWLVMGCMMAFATGFSVQVAQYIGAKKQEEACSVLKLSIMSALIFGSLLSIICVSIAPFLPNWLHGSHEIIRDATLYFRVYGLSLLFVQFRVLCGSMLQCSGDMKTPSILTVCMCLLDVVFNYIFIYMCDLGVMGAAMGTALAETVVSLAMAWKACFHSKIAWHHGGSWRWDSFTLLRANSIGLPIALEHAVLNIAQILIVRIVAPLGTVAVAANSLAVTAESLCYMPGYGIAAAATTLVGQSAGAKDREAVRSYARISTGLGVLIMTLSSVGMFVLAPFIFEMLTSSVEVQALGVKVLRMECLVEPFFATSIVVAGALRGMGDTLLPSLLNLLSMWGIRVPLSYFLAMPYGLMGVWFAMASELVIRGVLFGIRLWREKWIPAEL